MGTEQTKSGIVFSIAITLGLFGLLVALDCRNRGTTDEAVSTPSVSAPARDIFDVVAEEGNAVRQGKAKASLPDFIPDNHPLVSQSPSYTPTYTPTYTPAYIPTHVPSYTRTYTPAYKPFIAENGSYYGEISPATLRPRTVYVNGYYRRDGTYVRAHYRSR